MTATPHTFLCDSGRVFWRSHHLFVLLLLFVKKVGSLQLVVISEKIKKKVEETREKCSTSRNQNTSYTAATLSPC